ncbi:MAG: hypothetical protein KatS3mg031_0780 [Chitinophagales bacterium]|nr:MAG: hypothetical protein KatS3mg031_0780 [Chitinophagales bacterium]
MYKTIRICGLIAFMYFLWTSCKKDKADYRLLAEESAIAESVSEDVFKVVDHESKNGQYNDQVGKTSYTYLSSLDTCAVVTLNTTAGGFPMTLSIDFGSGCTDMYGTVRKGVIQCVFKGPYSQAGDSVIVSTDNYYVNNYRLDGTHIIVNKGRNGNGHLEFSVDVNGTITKPNGGIISWQSTRTNVWVAGEDTKWVPLGWLSVCDDIYEITGYGTGVTSDGHTFRLDITQPLVKKICCYWLVQGKVAMQVDGTHVADIDYGDGTCDMTATLTYGGNTYVVVIQ